MESFAEVCRIAYYEGVTPSNSLSQCNKTYKKLVNLAKTDFNNGRYTEFAGGFLEGEYFVFLWVAHMLLEYGKPNNELIDICLKVIENHSTNLLEKEVAMEEEEWLKINLAKYKR